MGKTDTVSSFVYNPLEPLFMELWPNVQEVAVLWQYLFIILSHLANCCYLVKSETASGFVNAAKLYCAMYSNCHI